jgi:isochorismate synthase EntC
VRNWVHTALARVCTDVKVEPSKALLKLSAVQHLYSKISGRMHRDKSDADLLVCSPHTTHHSYLGNTSFLGNQ